MASTSVVVVFSIDTCSDVITISLPLQLLKRSSAISATAIFRRDSGSSSSSSVINDDARTVVSIVPTIVTPFVLLSSTLEFHWSPSPSGPCVCVDEGEGGLSRLEGGSL